MNFLPDYDHTTTLLEDVLTPHLLQKSGPLLPVNIVDFKVCAHAIHNFSEAALDLAEDDEKRFRLIVKAMWAYRLNRGPDMLDPMDHVCLVVDDLKGDLGEEHKEGSYDGTGYWRHLEAHKLGMKEYKGNRSSKPSVFPIIEEEGYRYIFSKGSTFYYMAKQYYEADDLAGKICRLKREAIASTPLAQRYVLLNTVDGDWQGLVSDEHGVVWCNTGPWFPRARSEREVCDYYLRKNGLVMATARETYTTKVVIGDSGDNLAAGTPLRFFDLYDEDPQWGWEEKDTKFLLNVLNSNTPSNNKAHLESAKSFLLRSGFFLPECNVVSDEEKRNFFERAVADRNSKLNPELKGLNKKYCVNIEDSETFEKCKKLATQDDELRKSIKEKTLLMKSSEVEEEIKKLSLEIKKSFRTTIKKELETYLVVQ
jgi:hypothetical protein